MKCNYCGKSFSSQETLDKHLKMGRFCVDLPHSKLYPNYIKCLKCENTFEDVPHYFRHLEEECKSNLFVTFSNMRLQLQILTDKIKRLEKMVIERDDEIYNLKQQIDDMYKEKSLKFQLKKLNLL